MEQLQQTSRSLGGDASGGHQPGPTQGRAAPISTNPPCRATWAGGSHCEIQTQGKFQLLRNLAKLEEEQMMLQAAGRALQAGMLQEEGNLLCQMQTSRCEKSGCAGGRKDFASHSVSSKASHLSLLMPPARRDSPAWPHYWVGCSGAVSTQNVSLPLLRNRYKIYVKKRLGLGSGDWSIPGLRTYHESHEPSQHYKASRVCVLSACGLSFYLKRN